MLLFDSGAWTDLVYENVLKNLPLGCEEFISEHISEDDYTVRAAFGHIIKCNRFVTSALHFDVNVVFGY